jgi:hypothetical protein
MAAGEVWIPFRSAHNGFLGFPHRSADCHPACISTGLQGKHSDLVVTRPLRVDEFATELSPKQVRRCSSPLRSIGTKGYQDGPTGLGRRPAGDETT